MNSHLTHLLRELALLPPHWRLVPVNARKQPLGAGWQRHPFSPQRLLATLARRGTATVRDKNGKPYAVAPDGYGLLCGQTDREYLVAVDCDGLSARLKLQEVLRGRPLPPTVAFTSGRPGRCQYLFALPGYPPPLKSFKIAASAGEVLEIRGEGHQSVLPPSPHPQTGLYRWVPGCRPDQIPVASVPNELAQLMRAPPSGFAPFPTRPTSWSNFEVPPAGTSEVRARQLLASIHPRFADEYASWIFTGMALKYVSENLFPDWERWSRLSPKYVPGEPEYKWGTFNGAGITDLYLHWLARQSRSLVPWRR